MRYFKKQFFPKERRIKTTESFFWARKPHTTIKIPDEAKKHIRFKKADIITSTPAKKSDVTACFSVLEHYTPEKREVIIRI